MRCRWDEIGKRYYEAGADRGVVYPVQSDGLYTKGAPWNGLIGVTESPSGAEAKPLWANNHKYLTLISAEEYGGTIKAYTYPDEFAECDGTAQPVKGVKLGQQKRKPFGFCYRTLLGNDTENESMVTFFTLSTARRRLRQIRSTIRWMTIRTLSRCPGSSAPRR